MPGVHSSLECSSLVEFFLQILSVQEEEEHGRFIFLFIDVSTLETINSLKENCGKDYSYLSTYIYSINSVNSFSNDYLECIEAGSLS